jgi:endonuclease YncB( thermonuclease family)
MLRGQVFVGIAISLVVCALASAAPFTPQPFTQRGTVTAVVDSVTLDVRLADGTGERVQLVGLEAPAAGSCALAQAFVDLGALVSGKSLWLVVVPPKGKAKHLVPAYAILPGGADVGLELVRRGDATVSHRGPFKKLAAYMQAQKTAQAGKLGVWGCTSAAPSAPPPAAPQGQANGHDQDQGQDQPGKGNKKEKDGES